MGSSARQGDPTSASCRRIARASTSHRSARTLKRRLELEGTSYHYVTNTKLAYAEISFLIGFEEPGIGRRSVGYQVTVRRKRPLASWRIGSDSSAGS